VNNGGNIIATILTTNPQYIDIFIALIKSTLFQLLKKYFFSKPNITAAANVKRVFDVNNSDKK